MWPLCHPYPARDVGTAHRVSSSAGRGDLGASRSPHSFEGDMCGCNVRCVCALRCRPSWCTILMHMHEVLSPFTWFGVEGVACRADSEPERTASPPYRATGSGMLPPPHIPHAPPCSAMHPHGLHIQITYPMLPYALLCPSKPSTHTQKSKHGDGMRMPWMTHEQHEAGM